VIWIRRSAPISPAKRKTQCPSPLIVTKSQPTEDKADEAEKEASWKEG